MANVLESQHLRIIAAVARAESVTRAADYLNVTQSAVSHQLRELETRLGTSLFVRSGRRMLPTPAGRLIVEAAGDVLDAIGRVESKIEQIARHASGELRVCTHCYTGYSWLPALVEALRRRYPTFGLQIAPEYTLDPITALLEAKLDVALMNDESPDKRLRVSPRYRAGRPICTGSPSCAVNRRGPRFGISGCMTCRREPIGN